MKTYKLEAKLNGQWKLLCKIEAENHREGFSQAMLLLSPELYDKPIRLEEVIQAENSH